MAQDAQLIDHCRRVPDPIKGPAGLKALEDVVVDWLATGLPPDASPSMRLAPARPRTRRRGRRCRGGPDRLPVAVRPGGALCALAVPDAARCPLRRRRRGAPCSAAEVHWEERWRSVHAVTQRLSDDALPLAANWREQAAEAPSPTSDLALNEAVRGLKEALERRFAFDLGSGAARHRRQPSWLLPGRVEHAASIPRDDELERIQAAALATPDRRLLLTGCSGIGKSVLLAQLQRRLGRRLVYRKP